MDVSKRKRWALIALLVFVVLFVGGIVGFRMAVSVLKGKIVEALGPNSEIRDIRVGWFRTGWWSSSMPQWLGLR